MKRLALSVLLAVGCGGADSPTGAVQRLLDATERGDRTRTLQLLSKSTRAKLEPARQRAAEMAGRRSLPAEDLLAVGWAPPRERLASLSEIERDGARAVVELRGVAGTRERMRCVHEEGGWRIDLEAQQ